MPCINMDLFAKTDEYRKVWVWYDESFQKYCSNISFCPTRKL